MQATIVALYGRKPKNLHALLTDCQSTVTEMLGSRFRKYDIDQIHGTLVGLEREEAEPDRFINLNFKTCRDAEVHMDFGGLLNFLRDGGHLPLQLQIGGFRDRDYPFTSRDTRPFNRCFSLQGKTVVVVGWPVRGLPLTNAPSSLTASIQEMRLYPNTLDSMRRGAQRYGVLHSSHGKPEDTDNDFFFRIGMVDDPSSVDSALKTRVHDAMRKALGALPPLVLNVTLSDLHVVFYESKELPLATSTAYPLSREDLDDGFVREKFCGHEEHPARSPLPILATQQAAGAFKFAETASHHRTI